MYLVIAEKPSVSRAIAEVIGAQEREDGYLRGTDCMVSWCFGHLAEYVSPDAYDEKFNQWRYEDLPIIPKDWKVTVSEDKKDQFYILKRLLNSPEIEYVVNACDAGREGELIFKHVYDLSGSKKPVKRLWISSLEDSAILDGMQHLRSAEEYRHLAEAAVCRSQADWLVGMNATRAYTTKYFKKLTVGRVQTPTLAMLVERAGQISNFQKEKYFNVELDCDGIPAVKPKIFDPDEAEQLRSRCQGSEAIVTAVKETEKKVKAPKLYDLTTLQREANRTNSDLPAIYNGASAFLYTSLRESFGIPQLEAMACGTPVVTSAASAIPEVAGQGAILVDPTDPTAIADALLRLETDTEFRAGQVAYGLERVKQFSWEKTARHLLALYESLGKTN